jgi:hypothetical protein
MTLEETTQTGNRNKAAESKATESKATENRAAVKAVEKKGGENVAEGKSTRAIEEVTARAPSQMWLWLAGAGIAGSLALFLTGRRQEGIFVGLWPLTFLVMGNYSKIVKSIEPR